MGTCQRVLIEVQRPAQQFEIRVFDLFLSDSGPRSIKVAGEQAHACRNLRQVDRVADRLQAILDNGPSDRPAVPCHDKWRCVGAPEEIGPSSAGGRDNGPVQFDFNIDSELESDVA